MNDKLPDAHIDPEAMFWGIWAAVDDWVYFGLMILAAQGVLLLLIEVWTRRSR